jgi:vitamin B12/bleomycin/antimicrobial peptide transport system ATP-binding/permease protein
MNWNDELLASVIWVGGALFASLAGIVITVAVLARCTRWGRQFRRLSWAYFAPTRSKRPLAWLALIVLLTLLSVRLEVLFSYWYNGFYTAMQKLDAHAFWFMLLVFATLASVHVGRALLNFYVRQAFLIDWRIWLTDTLMASWLDRQAYYRNQYLAVRPDNPDQRIQQDVEAFVDSSLTLSTGLLDAAVSLVAFSLILWKLSGTLTLFGLAIPRAMVFLVYVYVIAATVFALKIGRPLIKLEFLSEQFNAAFAMRSCACANMAKALRSIAAKQSSARTCWRVLPKSLPICGPSCFARLNFRDLT